MTQGRKILFSSKLSMLVLSAFIIIIGLATFIENTYDTSTANRFIYDARWFEFLMFAILCLFIGKVFNNKLFSWEKLPQLIFHFSFLFLFIGGGITRYFGFEANMHILENESVNVLYTAEPYLQIRTADEGIAYASSAPLYFTQIGNNSFHLDFEINGGEKLEIDYQDYIFNAEEVVREGMNGDNQGKSEWVSGSSDRESPDALIILVTHKGKRHEAVLFYDDTRYTQPFQCFDFDDLQLELTYGPRPIDLPFKLLLKDFTLSKYPGSNIPSASESRVLLIDDRVNLKEEHLIYKNHVLDYDGYRFFQTSYDEDEQGTILSVNYDYYGTRITYVGYFLMILGALLVLFSKRSHFSQLNKKIETVRQKRKSLLMTAVFLVCMSGAGFSQNKIQNPVDVRHSEDFGHLLVQTYDGRFSSVHALAGDVMRKISGKDNFTVPGKGDMDAMHIFLDMHVDPEFWRSQKIVVVREKALREMLGLTGRYASFNDFIIDNRTYRLEGLSQEAFRKKASDQSSLDREILRVTERVSILNMTLNGMLLKLFPVQGDVNDKWVSWTDSLAFVPLSGELRILNDDLKLKEFNYSNIMRSYLISTIYARESGDYSEPDRIMGYIRSLQRHLTSAELLPSETKINMEIHYHKTRIFLYLKYLYAILSLALFVLSFIENFRLKSGKTLRVLLNVSISLLIAVFLYHSYGLGLRWYISGHAPWSNGYEVLLLVAWGGVLAGFSVIRYSKITLASTAILASLILMTAGHSYYDPQITHLEPVLKSYWLIIHVAIITIGYGFLALGFILGLLNLVVYLVVPHKKAVISSLIIEELTFINEKLLTVGMFLTAIGTFIGCVWANESWGSYWSWNAKQAWSLIIVLVYGVILHFRLIPKMKSALVFNMGAVVSFGSVIMTFIGVNYYFTKGLHSYASDDPPIFPVWAWIAIFSLIGLITGAVLKEYNLKKRHLIQ
jgi:cytochrome c-type biogenesis protein CcsB